MSNRRIDLTKLNQASVGKSLPPVSYDPLVVSVSDKPLLITQPIKISVPAKTFTFSIKQEELEKVLRAHIHETVKNLPTKHFLKVEPLADRDGEFLSIDITIIVPESIS